jgi:pyruvate-formate lyase
MNAILETHIRKIEQAYAAALSRALDRLEERERRRAELIRRALEGLDLEAEKERIKRIMSEIRENSASRRARRP